MTDQVKTRYQFLVNYNPVGIDSLRDVADKLFKPDTSGETIYPYKPTSDKLWEISRQLQGIIDNRLKVEDDTVDYRRDELFVQIHRLSKEVGNLANRYEKMTV